jgi:hypothetical protein
MSSVLLTLILTKTALGLTKLVLATVVWNTEELTSDFYCTLSSAWLAGRS